MLFDMYMKSFIRSLGETLMSKDRYDELCEGFLKLDPKKELIKHFENVLGSEDNFISFIDSIAYADATNWEKPSITKNIISKGSVDIQGKTIFVENCQVSVSMSVGSERIFNLIIISNLGEENDCKNIVSYDFLKKIKADSSDCEQIISAMKSGNVTPDIINKFNNMYSGDCLYVPNDGKTTILDGEKYYLGILASVGGDVYVLLNEKNYCDYKMRLQ